jgi:hypothetical protein
MAEARPALGRGFGLFLFPDGTFVMLHGPTIGTGLVAALLLVGGIGVRADDAVPPGLIRMPNGQLRPMNANELQWEAQRKAAAAARVARERRTPSQQAALVEQREQEQKDTRRIREDYEAVRDAQRAARRPIAEAQRLAALSAFGELFSMGIARSHANHAAAMSGAYQALGQQGAASQFEANRSRFQSSYNAQSARFQANSIDRDRYLADQQDNQLAFVGKLNGVFADFRKPLEELKALETAVAAGSSGLGGRSTPGGSQLGGGSVAPTLKRPDVDLADEVEDMQDRIDTLRKSLKQRQAALAIALQQAPREFRDVMLMKLTEAWWPTVRVAEEFLGRPFEAPEAGGRAALEAAQNAFAMETIDALSQQVERSREILRARQGSPAVVPATR